MVELTRRDLIKYSPLAIFAANDLLAEAKQCVSYGLQSFLEHREKMRTPDDTLLPYQGDLHIENEGQKGKEKVVYWQFMPEGISAPRNHTTVMIGNHCAVRNHLTRVYFSDTEDYARANTRRGYAPGNENLARKVTRLL